MDKQNKDIVGFLLLGGTGSRLGNLVLSINKHLLSISEVPMAFYAIKKFLAAGITEIICVVGMEHYNTLIESIGFGSKFACTIRYEFQEKPGGIAEAIALCEDRVRDRKICVILGDNIFEDDLRHHITHFLNKKESCRLFLKEVAEPKRFGVPSFDKKMRITKITEKPEVSDSSYAITGIYLYDQNVWNYIKKCNPSERGELEITDVNNFYVKAKKATYSILQGFWSDAGTIDSYVRTNKYFIDKYLNNQ